MLVNGQDALLGQFACAFAEPAEMHAASKQNERNRADVMPLIQCLFFKVAFT
jgi:hypothetical protein